MVLCNDETNKDFHFINIDHITNCKILDREHRSFDPDLQPLAIDQILKTAD